MKKRGYTLVETILVITILTILLTFSVTIINPILAIKEKIKLQNIVYEARELLSYGKAYAKRNSIDCSVYLDERAGNLILRVDGVEDNILRVVDMPRGIKIQGNFIQDSITSQKIKINDNGFISTSGTIHIKNQKNEEYKITIPVGNDIIAIYGPEG